MNRILKRVLMVVAGAVLVVALVWAMAPRPVEVESALVTRGALRVTVDEDGKTRVRERYVVSAPLTGRLLRIELDPGDAVFAKSTLLAAIEPRDPDLLDPRAAAEAEARVFGAEATLKRVDPEVASAAAEFELAKSEAVRIRQAFEVNAASRKELDDALLVERTRAEGLRSAEFSRQIAEFELKQSRAALLRTRSDDQTPRTSDPFEIHSPCQGVVLRVFQESTAVVDVGTQLIEVGDPSNLELVIDVLSTDAVKIEVGDEVVVERWGGEHNLAGRVRLVEPAAYTKVSALGVEEQRVNVVVDLVDPPAQWSALGDAYRVEARIVIWSHDDVVKAPSGALFRMGDDWAVFKIVDGRAQLRRIELGRRNAHEAEVLSGLVSSDVVVTHPGDDVVDGVAVRLR
jgi:HlyD family secretion protein